MWCAHAVEARGKHKVALDVHTQTNTEMNGPSVGIAMGSEGFMTKLSGYKFNGPEYIPQIDNKRLTKQHDEIRDLMLDEEWRTLEEIHKSTGFPQSSISAQLRHLRKPRFGSFVVERRARKDRARGLYEYRVLMPEDQVRLKL